jgi:hypothetical protein
MHWSSRAGEQPLRTIIVRRLKGRTDSVHYLERDEVNGLKLLHRQQQADGIKAAYVFINERGQPFDPWALDVWLSGLAKPLGCRSRFMSTCCGIRPDMHWRPGEWIHGGSSTSEAWPTPCATAMSPEPFKHLVPRLKPTR